VRSVSFFSCCSFNGQVAIYCTDTINHDDEKRGTLYGASTVSCVAQDLITSFTYILVLFFSPKDTKLLAQQNCILQMRIILSLYYFFYSYFVEKQS